jgi:hypothetical protein
MAEFGKRRDYKALHDRIKASSAPSAEELYVLASIMERCAILPGRSTPRAAEWRLGGQESLDKFVAALPAKAANRDKRIAAFSKLNHDPCAGLEGLKATEAEIDALLQRAAQAGDAKAQARLFTRSVERHMAKQPSNFLEVSDEDVAAIRRVMGSSDPNAIVDLVTALGYSYGNLSLRTGPDQEPVDFMALMFASHLAACDLGYPCGPDAPWLAQACAFSNQCDAASYRDHLFFYGSSPVTSQLASEYHHHLMRVIRDGDWSYFTLHRGPSPAFAPFQRR